MALTNDIVRTWRGPRAVMRDFLAQGPREETLVVSARPHQERAEGRAEGQRDQAVPVQNA